MLNIKQITLRISNAALFQANTNLNNCLLYDHHDESVLDNNFNPLPVAQTIAFTLQTLDDIGHQDTMFISIAKQIDESPTQVYLEPANNYYGEPIENLNPIYLPLDLNFKVAIILI